MWKSANILAILGGLTACTSNPSRAADYSCFDASPWAEADVLFREDPHWVGADGAYSIDLGEDRTLWLFGDTWIDSTGQHTRSGARMIRNSVAIQTGRNPASATIDFYWGMSVAGSAQDFFTPSSEEWFWPGHGIRLDDRLVLFLNRVRATDSGLGFSSVGWNALMIDNLDDEPSGWRMRMLETPSNPIGVIVGFASVLRWRAHVYAFGSADPVKSHPIYAVRWRMEDVREGNLQTPEWWAGTDIGWVADASSTPRWPLFENGQTELTIHFDDRIGQFLAVQTVGFGSADVAIRYAEKLTGPWSLPRQIYRPPEYGVRDAMIYSAKAHPQLTGGGLTLTYSTNTFDFQEHFRNMDIYYPRFVRLASCD